MPPAVSSSTSAPVNGRLPPDGPVDCAVVLAPAPEPEPDDPDPPDDFVTGGCFPPLPPWFPPPPLWVEIVVDGEQPV